MADLLGGFFLPVYITFCNRRDRAVVVRLFWLGVAIGFTWEGLLFLDMMFGGDPLVRFLREPPLPHPFFMLAHAFWDGGIFLLGLALVRRVCAAPVLVGFRRAELLVLVLWDQLSELAVEVVSICNQGWVYSDSHAWNPALFRLDGNPITLVPQLIWLAAPVVYYRCALGLAKRERHRRALPSVGPPRG